MTVTETLGDAHRTVRRAADSRWADRLARLGFVARGIVYGIIGLIALQVARDGSAGRTEANKEGALREIAERPLGGVLLAVLAAGLAGYALWRTTEALWGKRDEDDEAKRSAKRFGSAARAVFYGVFCVTTIRFMLNGPQEAGSGGEEEQTFVARVLDLPVGQWLVGGAGLAVIAGAIYIGYRGLAQKFDERLDTSEMGPVMGSTVDVLGTVGMVARSFVFSLAGYLLLRAAIDYDPEEAQGLDGTLKTLASQSYGQLLLAVAAIGLVAYGLYSWAEARYRQI